MKRVVVYILQLKDRDKRTGAVNPRKNLTLQWRDPVTGKEKSKTAGTPNRAEAEARAKDLEYELNHGLHREPSKMPWGEFRQLFENEKLAGHRDATQAKVGYIFDRFEAAMNPREIG